MNDDFMSRHWRKGTLKINCQYLRYKVDGKPDLAYLVLLEGEMVVGTRIVVFGRS